MTKERDQNLVINDELSLRLFTYNSNHRQNVKSVNKIEIYFLDSTSATQGNPEGRVLIKTIDEGEISIVDDSFGGQYLTNINLESDVFSIGKYIDVWYVDFNNSQSGTVTNDFEIIPDLWFASGTPIIYDFSFGFRPNRIRSGERKWINIDVIPNVPHASELMRYYVNLSISSPIKIYIEKTCGDCVPKEKDLRMVVDGDLVQYRRGSEGSYFIDTESLDMDCGIYNVWFEMEFGENKYMSDNMQLQIY
jgi:hypothetical protein